MKIKKITAAITAVTILAGMTACGNTADEAVSETTTAEVAAVSETTTVFETTAAAEETTTVSETDTSVQETTTVSEETTTVSETIAETNTLAVTEFTYVKDNIVDIEDKIPAEWFTAAETCLKGNERYSWFENYDADNYADVKDGYPPLVSFEEYLDENGKAKAKFTSGIIGDFNANGQNEGFIVLNTPHYFTEVAGDEGGTDFLIYINDNGEAEFVTQGYCITVCGELIYDGFSHINICMGENNSSIKELVYSTDGETAKTEIDYTWSIIIDDDNDRLLKGAPVSLDEYDGYIWDNNLNGYADITVSNEEYRTAEEKCLT